MIDTQKYTLDQEKALKTSQANNKVYIETYGCQMNVSDSEVVMSILVKEDYQLTEVMEEADLLLINTCSIRENAEVRIRGRLGEFRRVKRLRKHAIVGVIGCMAERLKEKLVQQEKLVDIVVGPDAYRDLPNLIAKAESGQKAINVLLSREETYAEIAPVRYASNGVSAFVSITRGCDNMCSYCVVPFTRGRERSRSPETILSEVQELIDNNFKEVTLLGQNVDKYKWEDENKETVSFANLLAQVAELAPNMRVRFSTSYPQDMTDEVLHTMASYQNICKHIHFPAQSGSTKVLTDMKRGYTREWYMSRVDKIREIMPDCAVTCDIISGFSGETEDDHKETLSMMELAKFDLSYMYIYSERPNTYAERNMKDDVPEDVKSRRLTEIIDLQHSISGVIRKRDVGETYEVLIEGISKKSNEEMHGRISQNQTVIFPKGSSEIGDFVNVKITSATRATLKGEIIDN